jgi:hypothetical protein
MFSLLTRLSGPRYSLPYQNLPGGSVHANGRQTKARTKARGSIGAHMENNEDNEIVVAITAAFVGNIHRGQRRYALGNR